MYLPFAARRTDCLDEATSLRVLFEYFWTYAGLLSKASTLFTFEATTSYTRYKQRFLIPGKSVDRMSPETQARTFERWPGPVTRGIKPWVHALDLYLIRSSVSARLALEAESQ